MSANNSLQGGKGNFDNNNNINNEHYENNSDSDNENNNEVLNNSMNGGLTQTFQRANLNPNINTQLHNPNQINPNQNLIGGGTREQFEIKEDEDVKTIEELNNNLLGIQNGGELDHINNAKKQGINNMMSSQSEAQLQSPTTQNHHQGLNMTFGTQNGGMQQQPQQYQPHQNLQQPHQPQQNLQQQHHQQQTPNYSGGNVQQQNSNRVNFDTNIKVVEIDSSKNDGYLYGNNKNLDPFKN